MKKLAQGFNTAAQDSNPGSLIISRESEALPLSQCMTCRNWRTGKLRERGRGNAVKLQNIALLTSSSLVAPRVCVYARPYSDTTHGIVWQFAKYLGASDGRSAFDAWV